MEKKNTLSTVVAHVIVVLVLLWTVFPLYWLVITAFKPLEEFMTYPPTFFPSRFTLDNFVEGLVRQQGAPSILDSAVIALGTFVLSMAVGVPAAYSIARYKTGGDDLSLPRRLYRHDAGGVFFRRGQLQELPTFCQWV